MFPETLKIPRMRTLPEAVKMLKEMDGSTAVTLRAVRRMANTGGNSRCDGRQ